MNDTSQVCVIIVLYYVKSNQINAILDFIKNQEFLVIFIDNTPDKNNKKLETICETHRRYTYKALRLNTGIAEAQNIGILEASKMKLMEYVLFLDQDSVIEKRFIEKMLVQFKAIESSEDKVAAVGPTIINKQNGEQYKQNIPKIKEFFSYYRSSIIISSGMFVRLSSLMDIGLMESKLFIDTVDFEWCWRAKLKGYSCFITKNVEMLHQVGEKEKSFLGHKFILSSPIRNFYQYRNFVLLSNRPYVPIDWKIKNFFKRIFLFIYTVLFASNKRKRLGFMIKGVISGLKIIIYKNGDSRRIKYNSQTGSS